MDMAEEAERLAQFGFAVLPLHTIEQRQCSCGNERCSSPGKHPINQLVPNGVLNATTDLQTIRQWFALWPDANVGIATGSVSGVTVIDVDEGHGGSSSIFHIQKNVAELPETWTATTGNGYHLYFQYVDGMRNKVSVLPGVDVRNDNAYVVAPPSLHASGKRYTWEVRPKKSTLAVLHPHMASVFGHTKEQRQAAEILPETISDGSRNVWMASAAGTLRRRGFAPESIQAALQSENKIRCRPPLDPEEIDRICWSVSRYPAGGGTQ